MCFALETVESGRRESVFLPLVHGRLSAESQTSCLIENRVDELLLGMNAHLPIDVLDVGLGGILGNSQLVLNADCGVSECEVLEYFLFAWREGMFFRTKLASAFDIQTRVSRHSRAETG